MANYFLCLILQRIFLPLFLIGCIAIRPIPVSMIILVFIFILPYIPVAQKKTLKGSTGDFFRLLILFSVIIVFIHLAFQITILILPQSKMKAVMKPLGIISLANLSPIEMIHRILPDVATFVSSLIIFSLIKKCAKGRKTEEDSLKSISIERMKGAMPKVERMTLTQYEKLKIFGIFSSLASLCIVGSLQPSVVNGVYFLAFLTCSTWFSCNQELNRKFAILLRFVSFVQLLQIIIFVLYQFHWFQELIDESSLLFRVSGISKIFSTNESNQLIFNINHNFDVYITPLMLIASYLIITSTSNFILNFVEEIEIKKTSEDINEDTRKDKKSKERQSFLENARRGSSLRMIMSWNVSNIFFKNAYIVTNLSMMIWSIVYHSWFGFVFLIWANAIWIMKNQRRIMLGSSPFLVFYALCLIIFHYIFNLNLTKSELPIKIEEVDMNQIGLVKYQNFPGLHLMIKSVLLSSFWMSMRLMYQEKEMKSNNSLLMAQKIQKLMEADSEFNRKPLGKILKFLEKACVYVWMWIIVFTLFAMGAFGLEMSVFRIINMIFFLVFILFFQLPIRFLPKLMYFYWSKLIVYAMLALILIYAYQFGDFPAFPLQHEIGLKKYSTTELFEKLLSFTIVIFMTGIQMNRFHQQFRQWILEEQKTTSSEENEESSDEEDISDWQKFKAKALEAFEKALVIIEIHYLKFLLLFSFWLFAYHLHMLNACFLILLTAGAFVSSDLFKSIILRIIAILSMIFICGVMCFELTNFHAEIAPMRRDAVSIDPCKFPEGKTLQFVGAGLHEWFNLDDDQMTFESIKPDIIFLIAVTSFFVLNLRQRIKRRESGEQNETPTLAFENVTRLDADESVGGLIKFLINYGFFKFGYEITLSMFVIVNFMHINVLTLFYIVLFVILVFRNREKSELLWKVARFIIFGLIIVQCLILAVFVAIKPCIGTKASLEEVTNINIFFLYQNLGKLNNNPEMLVADFLLLMLISMLLQVFKSEKARDVTNVFEGGGSNKAVLPEDDDTIVDGMNLYEHPVYQFKVKSENFVDLTKQIVFKIQYWLTLVVIFFVGINNADIFSIGYLGGAFVFLWFGPDFYMKPLSEIIHTWDILLIYNVFVIVTKIVIMIFGCQLGAEIPSEYCWLTDVFNLPCTTEITIESCLRNDESLTNIHDRVAFIFIIIQKRIFLSYYFSNVINETFASSALASRGAKMIEQLRIQEITKLKSEEKSYVDKLKLRMKSIKHSASVMATKRKIVETSHDRAIHGGDYYMFDEESDKKTAPKILINTTESEISTEQQESPKLSTTEKFKAFYQKCLVRIILSLHNASKDYSNIFRQLASERKTLKSAIPSNLHGSNIFENQQNIKDKRSKQISTLKLLDTKLQLIGSPNRHERYEPEISFTGLIKETFYFVSSKTDLLAYLLVCLAQISTSSILSLPLSLMILLWGTLTVPRPSKTFWILLIAYAQIVVIIKIVSNLKIFWWERDHYFIKMFGIQSASLAIYEILLIIVISCHRALLKMQGLWQSSELSFQEGEYLIKSCDANTEELIKISSGQRQIFEKEDLEEKISRSVSTDELIEEVPENEVIVKHVLSKDKLKFQSVYKNRKTFMEAEERIEHDDKGEFEINLKQGETMLSLRPIDVPDFSKNYSSKLLVIVENTIEEPFDFFPSTIWICLKRHFYIIRNFIKMLKPRQTSQRVDVYKFMFLCDFINFFVLLIGFKEFAINPAPNDTRTIIDYIMESKIPFLLLSLLVIQFAMIMIDRVFYLRKKMTGKLIFQLFKIIFTHIWMFFVLPTSTAKSLNETSLPLLYYVINCIYLLISAYQIRCGYPPHILGNFIMKKYGLLRLVAFKIYMLTPFLFELRTVFDWMFTETSLIFSEWIKVEAIYAQVFQIKCSRVWMEDDALSGKKRLHRKKFLVGGLNTSFLIGAIWLPLVLFALIPAIGEPNLPLDVSVSFEIRSFSPMYEAEVSKENIKKFTETQWKTLVNLYEKQPTALAFLEEFSFEDVVAVPLTITSSTLWNISPPNLKKIIEDFENGSIHTCHFNYKVSRLGLGSTRPESFKGSESLRLNQEIIKKLTEVLKTKADTPIEFSNIFPKILVARNKGELSPVRELLMTNNERNNIRLRNVTMKFHESKWWTLKENCQDDLHLKLLQSFPFNDCESFNTIYIFNEKSFPNKFKLGDFAVQGIIGLYVTLIVFTSKLLRSTIFDTGTEAIFVWELPNVDRIINLCNDIYTVREAHEFALEENLVAKLLLLYRSPETLVKWTMLKDK